MIIKQDKDIQAGNQAKLADLVETRILPFFDFNRMTQIAAVPGDTEVTVKSEMKQPGTVPLTMDYDMEKLAAGWKVYDIKIDGISLVTTYRETFAGKVREGGVDGRIKSLADKNRQGDARFRSHQT